MSLKTWGLALEGDSGIEASSLFLHPGQITTWSHCALLMMRLLPHRRHHHGQEPPELRTKTPPFCRLIASGICSSSGE